ncbi:MAG: 50S ribosomal protein L29 [Verrucomicrobia bacterium]|nr:50S ribosomal protein L29 [Verrucomicrobiota bacterium]
MSKMKEFENQSPEELKATFVELSKKMFEMRNEISTTHKIEKAHLLRKAKRDRARVMTILNRK